MRINILRDVPTIPAQAPKMRTSLRTALGTSNFIHWLTVSLYLSLNAGFPLLILPLISACRVPSVFNRSFRTSDVSFSLLWL
jgi:hypothetical protein